MRIIIIKKTFSSKVNGELLREITGANFLAAMTLLVSYYKRIASGDDERVAVTCKKRDILKLDLTDYQSHHDALVKGFCEAADFLKIWCVPIFGPYFYILLTA